MTDQPTTKLKTVEEIAEPAFRLLHPIFRDCVGPETFRYSIGAPFLWRDHVAATDGRILVLQPATDELTALLSGVEERRLPKVEAVIDRAGAHHAAPCRLPPLPGKTMCEECDGVGEAGKSLFCYSCDGKGSYYDPEWRVWLSDDCDIGLSYAHILRDHKARIFLPLGGPGTPVKFTFVDSDAFGFLMPLSRPEEDQP